MYVHYHNVRHMVWFDLIIRKTTPQNAHVMPPNGRYGNYATPTRHFVMPPNGKYGNYRLYYGRRC